MKKVYSLVTGLFLVGIFSFFTAHDFYNSLTKVEYNAASNSLQMNSKLDLEDLESALGVKANSTDFSSKVQQYFNSNISIKVNGTSKSISVADNKVAGQVVWVYFNVSGVSDIKSIEMKNTLLISKFPKQENYVNFVIDGVRKSITCNKNNPSGTVTF